MALNQITDDSRNPYRADGTPAFTPRQEAWVRALVHEEMRAELRHSRLCFLAAGVVIGIILTMLASAPGSDSIPVAAPPPVSELRGSAQVVYGPIPASELEACFFMDAGLCYLSRPTCCVSACVSLHDASMELFPTNPRFLH